MNSEKATIRIGDTEVTMHAHPPTDCYLGLYQRCIINSPRRKNGSIVPNHWDTLEHLYESEASFLKALYPSLELSDVLITDD